MGVLHGGLSLHLDLSLTTRALPPNHSHWATFSSRLLSSPGPAAACGYFMRGGSTRILLYLHMFLVIQFGGALS